ncbi:MAG: cytochrome C biogenesis protein [Rhodoplanes sp.]|uniref:protein-disulfide reductase DsbD domain-containing protein n=1 Tax=Rhodoplanes sp. TaxID=1968906 RepID=UPI00183D0E42|nr:protein-disulfide reductase DsbD domain-containing protein [Rhodoplanes sp.]NVO17872.1 cytochrome C biogenesis protein [Rhodoplanes sp.]
MNGPTLRRHASTLLLAATAAVATAAGAFAGGEAASAWTGDRRAMVRLVGGTPVGGAPLLAAGVEIRLADGWKTYWRYPGDSGVPPRFDFTGSVNVRAATVGWPAPMRFEDGGGTAIGYSGRVMFPVRVERDDPSRPATLALSLDYAICERLCVPATASTSLTLPAGSGGEAAAGNDVAAALARVPRRAALGEAGPLAIRAVRVEGAWPKPRIVVTVAAPPGTVPDLFAEGPTEAWALPVPEPAGAGPDGTRLFAFVVDGAPPDVDPRGATVTLTAVAGDAAIEVQITLDR